VRRLPGTLVYRVAEVLVHANKYSHAALSKAWRRLIQTGEQNLGQRQGREKIEHADKTTFSCRNGTRRRSILPTACEDANGDAWTECSSTAAGGLGIVFSINRTGVRQTVADVGRNSGAGILQRSKAAFDLYLSRL
jgi:hypothetical protein